MGQEKRLEAAKALISALPLKKIEAFINMLSPSHDLDFNLFWAWVHAGGKSRPDKRIVQEAALKLAGIIPKKKTRHDRHCNHC